MKNWGLDQIGFTVDPTLIFDMTKAKALYIKIKANEILLSFSWPSVEILFSEELFL